jgi:hypothetical protein
MLKRCRSEIPKSRPSSAPSTPCLRRFVDHSHNPSGCSSELSAARARMRFGGDRDAVLVRVERALPSSPFARSMRFVSNPEWSPSIEESRRTGQIVPAALIFTNPSQSAARRNASCCMLVSRCDSSPEVGSPRNLTAPALGRVPSPRAFQATGSRSI